MKKTCKSSVKRWKIWKLQACYKKFVRSIRINPASTAPVIDQFPCFPVQFICLSLDLNKFITVISCIFRACWIYQLWFLCCWLSRWLKKILKKLFQVCLPKVCDALNPSDASRARETPSHPWGLSSPSNLWAINMLRLNSSKVSCCPSFEFWRRPITSRNL